MQANTIALPRILPRTLLKGSMRSAQEQGLFVVHHQSPVHQGPEKKPRIYLVPGIGHTAATFEFLSNALVSRDFDVTAIDLPGHTMDREAYSDRQFGRLTLENYRDAIINFLGAREEPVFLLGHSMGGLLGQMVVAKMGREKVKGLILLASAVTSDTRMGIGLTVFVQTLKNIFSVLFKRPGRFKDQDAKEVFFNGELADELFASFSKHFVEESGMVFRQIMRTTVPAWLPYSYRLAGSLENFRELPVLQLNSAFDRIITAGTSGRLSKYLEGLGARLTVFSIPGPHNLHWNNVEAVADMIGHWEKEISL